MCFAGGFTTKKTAIIALTGVTGVASGWALSPFIPIVIKIRTIS
jgi:hypothetical protein